MALGLNFFRVHGYPMVRFTFFLTSAPHPPLVEDLKKNILTQDKKEMIYVLLDKP